MDTDSFFTPLSNSQKEPRFKSELLKLLKNLNPDWIDGDAEPQSKNRKTADIVNHTLKIALELKMEDASERLESLPNNQPGVFTRDLSPLGDVPLRYGRYIQSCEEKFANYSNYRTLLLVRTKVLPLFFMKDSVIEMCNMSQEIGMLLLLNADECSVRCFTNEFAKENRKLSAQELEDIFGLRVSHM